MNWIRHKRIKGNFSWTADCTVYYGTLGRCSSFTVVRLSNGRWTWTMWTMPSKSYPKHTFDPEADYDTREQSQSVAECFATRGFRWDLGEWKPIIS